MSKLKIFWHSYLWPFHDLKDVDSEIKTKGLMGTKIEIKEGDKWGNYVARKSNRAALAAMGGAIHFFKSWASLLAIAVALMYSANDASALVKLSLSLFLFAPIFFMCALLLFLHYETTKKD